MTYKILILSLLGIQLSACNSDEVTKPTEKTERELNVDFKKAQKWLIHAIEANFKNFDPENMEKICTPTYFEYKNDATGVEYDGGMDEADFQKKWKDRYDLKYAGIGTGFLISGQDWSKIKVVKCELISPSKGADLVFSTLIRDVEMNEDYKRDIKLIRTKDAFLIDDVKEYN